MTETNPINAEEDFEECNVVVLTKDSHKRRNKIVWCVVIAIFTIALIIGLSVLIRDIASVESAEKSKDDALYEIDGIHKDLNEFTESDYNTFDGAFAVFDTNDDGSLNMEEFRTFFEMQLNNASTFEIMDFDNDGILSYAECVAQIKYGIGALDSWIDTLSPLIYEKYGYDHSDSSISNTDLFLEYAAIMTFFDVFDTDNNGYIHKKEWLSITSQNEFLINDIDSDGEITEDEFSNILYGTDEKSWKGLYARSVHYESTLVTTEMVKEVQMSLTLCPTQVQNTGDSRRRLDAGSTYQCHGGICGTCLMAQFPCYRCYAYYWYADVCATQLPRDAGTQIWIYYISNIVHCEGACA